MSDTNRTAIGVVEETTVGTTPASPAFTNIRTTGHPNLAYSPKTVTSEEIRSDRQVTDLALVGAEAGGDIAQELSFQAADLFIEGALFNDWTALPKIENTAADTPISDINSSGNTITVAASGTLFTAYDIIYIENTDNNDGEYVCDSGIDSTHIYVTTGLTDEAAVPATAKIHQIGFQGPTGDIVATTSGGNALVSTTTDFTDFFAEGDWFQLGGADSGTYFDTGCGWCRVANEGVASTRLDLDIVPTGFTTQDGSGRTINIYLGDKITNSTTEKSYTIERQYQDHTSTAYEYFTGMEVDTLALSIEAESIAKATVSFIGMGGSIGTSRAGSASDVTAPDDDVLNTSSNVARIARGSTAVGTPNFVTGATIEIKNNLRRQTAVGSLAAVGIGSGTFEVTGNLNTYFGDTTLMADVLANTETSLNMVFKSNSDKCFLIDLPRMKYSSGAPDVPNKDADVFTNLGFQAIRHAGFGYTVKVQQFHYVPDLS